jgi:hypothetical protein
MGNRDPIINTTQKTKEMDNRDPTINTTQKTKEMGYRDPTINTTQKTKETLLSFSLVFCVVFMMGSLMPISLV